uniref:glucuronosyltransferase n=1 Tax=Parastrongyloides trichosuri TaxID=131310 RepID=A0A0N4ZHW2_PARTI
MDNWFFYYLVQQLSIQAFKINLKILNKNKILSLRKKNILISFVTITKNEFMPKDMKNSFFKTIKRFKDITFVWKCENTNNRTYKEIDNLILSKRLFQSVFLKDKRSSLFITYGSWSDTTETFFKSVSAISILVMRDQLRNG